MDKNCAGVITFYEIAELLNEKIKTRKIDTSKMNDKQINQIMDNINKNENLCIVRQALEQNLKVCCNEEMIYLEHPYILDVNTNEHKIWVCSKCGKLEEEKDLSLDDEELYNLLSNYQDEIRKTPIWEELKKEFEE